MLYEVITDMLRGLKKGGTFLLNSIWDAEETKNNLPDSMKKYLAENEINFYIINATSRAEELGLGNRTNTIMQSAFFKIANVIPYDKAVVDMKKMIVKSFGKKGEEVVITSYSIHYTKLYDPFTTALVVPNKDALKHFLKVHHLHPESEAGIKMALQQIQKEIV